MLGSERAARADADEPTQRKRRDPRHAHAHAHGECEFPKGIANRLKYLQSRDNGDFTIGQSSIGSICHVADVII